MVYEVFTWGLPRTLHYLSVTITQHGALARNADANADTDTLVTLASHARRTHPHLTYVHISIADADALTIDPNTGARVAEVRFEEWVSERYGRIPGFVA